MRSTFTTPFDEEYARRCICSVFPELKWDLQRQDNDPPDVADLCKNISVEVVRAIDNGYAQLLNTYAEHIGKGVETVPSKLLTKITNDGYDLIYDDDGIIIGTEPHFPKDLYLLIKERIISKTKSLNNARYPKFETDCIFVYNSDSFCFENGLLKLMDEIESEINQFNRYFKIVFIYCTNKLFLYDRERKTIQVRNVSCEDVELMKEKTLKEIGRNIEYNSRSNFIIK